MSALTDFRGFIPMLLDPMRAGGTAMAYSTTGVMDASTERVGVIGCVYHPTQKTGTINIRKIHFRCGAVTFNALSTLRVSLQNVSATAGPPYQPDGTQDQTADMTTLTANGWNTTGNLSADRAVDLSADSLGDVNSRWLAVVWEYQTFTAADSVVISGLSGLRNEGRLAGGQQLLYTGSWAIPSNVGGVIVLECDDGSFAFLQNCLPYSALSTAAVSSTAAIRRAGIKFKVPVELKIDRVAFAVEMPNNCDGRLVLYDSDGTTELRSIDLDNDALYAANDPTLIEACFEPVTLAADTFYRLAFVGGTSTSATIRTEDVNAAGHMDGCFLGQNAYWTQHDGASWTDTTTRRCLFGIGISAIHDGAGGAGGLLTHPGMAGGMRG